MGQVYTPKIEQLLGPARKPEEPLTSRHEAIAASLQVVFEEAVFHVLNALYEKTRLPRLCLAGGCAMNSVMNGKIRERRRFKRSIYSRRPGTTGRRLARRCMCSTTYSASPGASLWSMGIGGRSLGKRRSVRR